MKQDKEITKVIFRKMGDEVIAIFPEIVSDQHQYNCQSYMHIGQHSSCTPSDLSYRTNPAKPEEYKDLFEELQSLGYKLKVYQHYTYAMQETRIRQWKEFYK